MFVNEKELVEKLVLDLQERFGTQYIVRELRGGNNIADIVYTTDINRSNIIFDEYFNAYYYFNGIYNHKKISLNEMKIIDERVNRKFYHFLRELENLGYIKISDWKAGLEQAIRYKQYANEVYVALSSEYVKNVDRQQFRELNIGLMSVSAGKLKISIRARKQPVEKLDIQYYIADRFLKQLKLLEMLE